MSSSGSLFTDTLLSITTTKLDELSKKRAAFEKHYFAVRNSLQAEQNHSRRLCVLLDGTKRAFGAKTYDLKTTEDDADFPIQLGSVVPGSTGNKHLETDLKNVDRFLQQVRYDPSVSTKILEEWERTLLQYLDVQFLKYQYATLYGQLVTEWLSADKSTAASSSAGDVEMSEAFENIPDADKMESRAQWEQTVFEPKEIDQAALDEYLNQLFGVKDPQRKDAQKALKDLRESVSTFGRDLAATNLFNVNSVKSSIEGLLSSDLLTDEKREVLKDFKGNFSVLSEISDVLNMRMAALSSWSWGTEVSVEQRRQVNGNYNILVQEDLLQAIFLQWIGVKWSVFLRGAFATFAKNKEAWKRLEKTIPKSHKQRIEYYLGSVEFDESLQRERRKTHWQNYFLFQLLKSETQQVVHVDGDMEAELLADMDDEYEEERSPKRKVAHPVQMARRSTAVQAPRRQLASKARRMAAPSTGGIYERAAEDEWDEEVADSVVNPMEVKQKLLHILSTEIVVNKQLHGQFTAIKTVFDQWNPALPHATVLAVLKFLGVSGPWLTFFRTFLEAPLKFADEQSAPTRIRKRGTPASHTLSDVFGESVLFCLDLAVNQRTDGGLLYRMFDEIWFWSPEHGRCVQAWKTITQFANVMGVSMNDIKTGSATISKNPSFKPDPSLPAGQIRWGFLNLSNESGRFEIDQSMVDHHIGELRRQLSGKEKSIFSWIQVWNTYASTFFTSNFGRTANCYGRKHVDNTLATHQRIHRTLFENHPLGATNVIEYLKKTIEQRFGVTNVPDSFFYFPIELGGLELRSPYVSLLQIRDQIEKDPIKSVVDFQEDEEASYRKAKGRFERGEVDRYDADDPDWEPEGSDRDTFMSFEEFVRYREEFRPVSWASIEGVYGRLLEKPGEHNINGSTKVMAGIEALAGQGSLKDIRSDWYGMEGYWKWVAQLYGPELMDRFGGLSIVDRGLLPIGLVGLFRSKRVNWQG